MGRDVAVRRLRLLPEQVGFGPDVGFGCAHGVPGARVWGRVPAFSVPGCTSAAAGGNLLALRASYRGHSLPGERLMGHTTSGIRNIALVGAAGAGKTLLAESLL